MILLVEPLIEGLDLRIKPFDEGVYGIRQGIHVGSIPHLVVFIARQDKFLKLVQQVYLVLHKLCVLCCKLMK